MSSSKSTGVAASAYRYFAEMVEVSSGGRVTVDVYPGSQPFPADDHVLVCRKDGDEPQLFRMKDDPEQRDNMAASEPEVVKRLYELVLDDAGGGPILPKWKVDPMLLKIPSIKAATSWHEWSPFREWHMPEGAV